MCKCLRLIIWFKRCLGNLLALLPLQTSCCRPSKPEVPAGRVDLSMGMHTLAQLQQVGPVPPSFVSNQLLLCEHLCCSLHSCSEKLKAQHGSHGGTVRQALLSSSNRSNDGVQHHSDTQDAIRFSHLRYLTANPKGGETHQLMQFN